MSGDGGAVTGSVLDRVRNCVSHMGPTPEELELDTDVYLDLGFDELDMVELGMWLEEEFDIAVDDEEVARASTVRLLVEMVKRLRRWPGRRPCGSSWRW